MRQVLIVLYGGEQKKKILTTDIYGKEIKHVVTNFRSTLFNGYPVAICCARNDFGELHSSFWIWILGDILNATICKKTNPDNS